MIRPDAACLCIGQGIHAAVYVQGEHRERLLAARRWRLRGSR